MRVAGKLAASVLNMIGAHVKPGVTTGELDRLCHDYIVNEINCIPAPLNYTNGTSPPFPKSVCTSVNHVVCHGIPSDRKTLKNGDALNIDITVIHEGYYGDTSKMFFVGKPTVLAERLVKVTQECLYKGINEVKPGAKLGQKEVTFRWFASSAGTASAIPFTANRRYCTTAAAARARHCSRAWHLPSSQ